MSGRIVFEHHLGDYAVPSQCAIGHYDNIYVTVDGPLNECCVVQINHNGGFVQNILSSKIKRFVGICFNDSCDKFVVVGQTLEVFSFD
ncbi:hypothetical protein DPMN_171155 [Dreissena polymorpha]|uniref:Uncharacterized protein n=1 Tax=Dreissena polymorpha TaxID=45954 RepID=A0A9D4E0Q0_DREPO|nr:hypothetical protein DPMN_171155 [Dreissena polymorpha]